VGVAPGVAVSKVITPSTGQLVLVTSRPIIQNPNWVNINDSQIPNWSSINEAQTPNWVSIAA
jgi:hypothetical protein